MIAKGVMEMLHEVAPHQIVVVSQTLRYLPVRVQESARIFVPTSPKYVLITVVLKNRPAFTLTAKGKTQHRPTTRVYPDLEEIA